MKAWQEVRIGVGSRMLLGAIAVAMIVLFCGCATTTVRDRVQVSALGIGEAALTVDRVERELYTANAYDATTHARLGDQILKMLYASRAYERAAASWPEGSLTVPEAIATATQALLNSLDDIERTLPTLNIVKDRMGPAIEAVRATIPIARLK